MTVYSIQEVAEKTGLSGHTLRYYERIGLLSPVSRASSGHRCYTEEDIAWIQFLNKMRATGMPIRQMQRYAELVRAGDHTRQERMELLLEHQSFVESQLKEVEQNLQFIKQKILIYKELDKKYEEAKAG
jgi:DNA-binding transcriptional MerR regulator